MKSKLAITRAPSVTKYLVLDSSSLLAQTRRDRSSQFRVLQRAQGQRYNSDLRRAITVALTSKGALPK